MPSYIETKWGATIEKAFSVELPAGYSWQVKAELRTFANVKLADFSTTLAKRGGSEIWDGTLFLSAVTAAVITKPTHPNIPDQYYTSLTFFLSGDTTRVLKSDTILVTVKWDPNQ